MSIFTLLSSGLSFTRSIEPVKLLNPPSCLPVTFDPVKSTLEFSGVIARLSTFPATGAGAAACAFDAGVAAFDVTAFVLFAAGSSHATRKLENNRIAKPNFFITKLSLLKDYFLHPLLHQSMHYQTDPQKPRIKLHQARRQAQYKARRCDNRFPDAASKLTRHKNPPFARNFPCSKLPLLARFL